MEWCLRGRCELHDARRGEWWASVVLPQRSPAAFIGNEVEDVMGRDTILQAIPFFMGEGLYLEEATILHEVYRDPRRDGSRYLFAGPDFRASYRVEVRH